MRIHNPTTCLKFVTENNISGKQTLFHGFLCRRTDHLFSWKNNRNFLRAEIPNRRAVVEQ